MHNILYLDDYINLYSLDLEKIIVYKPYKNTLKNGRIIDKNKFIKVYSMLLTKYNLNNPIFNRKLLVIVNKDISVEDKNNLINVLEDLNYKNIKIENEIKYLNIKKDSLFIGYNYNYFYLYYIDNYGNVKDSIYKNDYINQSIIPSLIKSIDKKKIFIFGKNYEQLINILKKYNIDYYYYYDSDNLLIKLKLNEKLV